ncbi:MAG: hypothetical protein ACFFDD_07575, partial [Promethearchaeota archaeon]
TRRTKADIRKIELQDNAGLPEFDDELVVGWGGMYPDSKTKKEIEPDIKEYFEKRGDGLEAEEDTPEVDEDVVVEAETVVGES